MSTTTTLSRRRNAVALLTGVLDVLIALTVLAGYAAQDPVLVTLVPGSAPMRLTTAIAVLCCGAAILLLAGGSRRVAAFAAAICGIVGAANLVEAAGNFRIAGFDMTAFAGGATPRAGTLISCLLILAAVALLLMSGIVTVRARLAMVGFSGSVLFCIGAVAAVSYFAGVSSAFTVGAFSQLSIPTAVALAAVGAALIRFAWRDSLTIDAGTPAWLPLLVGAGTLTTSFCLYAAIAADQKSDFAHQVAFDAEGLRQFVSAGLENRVQPLIRLARHRAASPDLKKDDWDADAQMILTRGGYQAIEWIDASDRVVWSTPPGAGDNTPDGSAAFEARRRAAFDTARRTRALAATRPVDLVTGGKGTIVLVPVFIRDELAGYVAGVFRYNLLFQNLLSSNPSPQYSISLRDGGEPIFAQGVPNRSAGLSRTADLPVGGTIWKLEIAPTETLILQSQSPVGGALLVGGGLLALLFSLFVRVAQRPGTRPVFDLPMSPMPASGAIGDAAQLPIISYGRDGAPMAWNEVAKALFGGAPPRVPAYETGFRVMQATLLRSSGSPGSTEALRGLLDSCAQPALVFDAEGRFVAGNPAAARMLGWSEAIWNGRSIGTILPAGREPLDINNVLLMQGRWSVPAAGAAMTATTSP